MAVVSWAMLEEELARWHDEGRPVEFWWRDDDATAPTAPVRRLLDLSATTGVPLALAVIPLAAKADLFEGIRARVLLHGTDHRNRAAAGEKKTEFASAEADDAALGRLREARERLERLAGPAYLPVLAPPWNRFKRALLPALASIAVRGFSGYGPRPARQPARGIVEANTHVDIIDWRGTRGFCGEEAALAAAVRHLAARRSGFAESSEPTGWLTHHELHDDAAWNFLAHLFERTRRLGARWVDAASIFTTGA
jgi:hypothetical protein